MWILGTYAPLPYQMQWRSEEVEATIAESKLVLAPYAAEFYVPGIDAYDLTGKKLKKVLEPATYKRWNTLRKKYIKRDGKEDWLPASAAFQLQARAFQSAGLSFDDQVWRTVKKIAREHRVRVSDDHQIRLEVMPRGSVDLGTSVYYEPAAIEFLTRTLDRLEKDLTATKARANAWAVGDLRALRGLMEFNQEKAYMASLAGPFMAENGIQDLFERADEKWLFAAKNALSTSDVTFAILPVSMLMDPNGLLAKLGAMGYDVQAPR
ncbi:MAG: TraB/GumN family protein [Steroidobacter sp.]|nr:TraB/GumN family protein [Steroidobacter sp.]